MMEALAAAAETPCTLSWAKKSSRISRAQRSPMANLQSPRVCHLSPESAAMNQALFDCQIRHS